MINYTNPMALCMRVLYDTFPGIMAVGCCHEVFHTQTLLCKALAEFKGIENVTRQGDYRTTVQGVNHFTFITRRQDTVGSTSIPYTGSSATGIFGKRLYRRKRRKLDEPLSSTARKWSSSTYSAARVRLRLPAIGTWRSSIRRTRYLSSPEKAHSYRFTLTPVSWRKKNHAGFACRNQSGCTAGKKAFELKPTGEEGVLMIKAVAGLENDRDRTSTCFQYAGQITKPAGLARSWKPTRYFPTIPSFP